MAWKERFGAFALEQAVALQTATQQVVDGTVCGPALIRVEGFRAVHGEVLFIEMEPEEGEYEPLLGYIPLEQCGAAVDLIGHRLLPARYVDAKALPAIDDRILEQMKSGGIAWYQLHPQAFEVE